MNVSKQYVQRVHRMENGKPDSNSSLVSYIQFQNSALWERWESISSRAQDMG